MEWIRRDSCKTIEDVIERNTNTSIDKFIDVNVETEIPGLNEAYEMILKAITDGEHITIFGDYDADGVTSTAILWSAIRMLSGKNPTARLPRRFSEGYGFSMKAVDEINEGLLITVDNGIAAVEPIAKIKEKGVSVIIIDHHLAGDEVPKADVIVNPHYQKNNESDFHEWCGAGLAYRLCKKLIPHFSCSDKIKRAMHSYFIQLAAIGTVCDVMPLVKDNRKIVIEGLKELNQNPCKGIKAILTETETEYVDEMTCGFLLGPMINAAGRMEDDGPMVAFDLLTASNREGSCSIETNASALVEYNTKRKALVAEALESTEEIIAEKCLYGNYPLVVVNKTISEGIIGIIAGKLAEKYGVSTIVFTESSTPGVLKGSARTAGGVSIKEMMDAAKDYILRYGGHPGAGGLSIDADKMDDMYDAMNKYMGEYDIELQNDIKYDLEVDVSELATALVTVKKYAPYGEGNPRIVFKIKPFYLSPRQGLFYKLMGEKSEHIKLFGNEFSAIGFGLSSLYDDSEDKSIECVGSLSENIFRGCGELQIEMQDFKHCSMTKTSALAELLATKLKSL